MKITKIIGIKFFSVREDAFPEEGRNRKLIEEVKCVCVCVLVTLSNWGKREDGRGCVGGY